MHLPEFVDEQVSEGQDSGAYYMSPKGPFFVIEPSECIDLGCQMDNLYTFGRLHGSLRCVGPYFCITLIFHVIDCVMAFGVLLTVLILTSWGRV